MVRDEKLAEHLAQTDDSPAKPERRMADWSADVEMLTAIYDRLGEVVMAFASSRGARHHRLEPGPRPTTAIRKYKDRVRQDRHLALVAQVLPQRAAELAGPE